jgi:transcriptional regulator GlxA family with amidase domain
MSLLSSRGCRVRPSAMVRMVLSTAAIIGAGLPLSAQSATNTRAATPAAKAPAATPSAPTKTVGVVLFPGFEVLDVYGPVEMLSYVPGFKVIMIAEQAGPVRATQGVSTMAEFSFASAPPVDILLVPGGLGTFREINNRALLDYIRSANQRSEVTASVCTGSALLAKAGLLSGLRATTNKNYFAHSVEQDSTVRWQHSARWVEDGKMITSSGVSAGTDMSLGLIARFIGKEHARHLARNLEYIWNDDPTNDPFAIPAARKVVP